MNFEYNGKSYEVIIEKKNNKNTYIRVKDDLKIYISTSYLTPSLYIKNLIKNNRDSIIKMIETQEKKQNKKDGYYFLGEKIEIVKSDIKKPFLEDGNLYVKSKEDITKWYNKQVRRVFRERLDTIYNTFTENVLAKKCPF